MSAAEASPGGRVAGAAILMVLAILGSRLLALVRDMVVSYYFGAGMVTDAYKAAFSLPDLLYYLIAGGALSTAFIPVFTEYLEKQEEEAAWHVFSVIGTVVTVGLIPVVLVGWLFTEQLLYPFCAGFSAEKLSLTASLTRIILPAQICFFLGGLMMGTLYSLGHFRAPALGPLIYNIGIITGGLIGGAYFGSFWGIYGLAWGVLGGAILGNVLLQIVALRRLGVRYRPSFDVRHEGVVRVARLVLPVLLGLSLPQFCLILTRAFASPLGDGPITWLDNGNKLMQLPLGIFGQALSVAVFPTLSRLSARGETEEFRNQLNLGMRSILFLTIPSAVLLIVLAGPVTALVFERGRWTSQDTAATAHLLVLYSFAIFAVSGQQIVNRGFYALKDTLTPTLVGSGATVGFVVLGAALVGVPWAGRAVPDYYGQVRGSALLAISYSVLMAAYLAVLLLLLRRKLGGFGFRTIAHSVSRVCIAALIAGGAAWGVKEGLAELLSGGQSLRGAALLAQVGSAGIAGVLAYLATVRLLRVPEAETALAAVTRRLRRGSGA